jgi:dTDP-N-acetylfucosamine:lipid II N-acetylfucosaminyltransferase
MNYTIEIQKAENLYCEGKFEEAISLFKTIIEKNPDSYVAYNNMGVIYYELGDSRKAKDFFTKALTIKEDYQDALLNIADYFQNNNNFTVAAEYLEKVLNHNDRDTHICNRLGALYLETGNEKKAREILIRSLKINPDQESVKDSLKLLESKNELSPKNANEIKILHVMQVDKFLPPFIDFVDKNFGRNDHQYVFIEAERYDYGLSPEHGVEFFSTIDDIFITLKDYMYKAEKIILHGLWRNEICILLYYNQDLLKKCYWVMWGGDFYFPEQLPLIKKLIIRNIGHTITGTIGDFELAKKYYGTQAKHHKCFSYVSNVFKDYSDLKSASNNFMGKKILIGNSANPTNNHFEILDKISTFNNDNLEVICPLSYGNIEYAEKVINKGHSLFGNKFKPLTDFIPLEEYIKILAKVDIAIFAHNRQQAMGNIGILLGLGKKIYMRDDTTLWSSFHEINVKIYSFNKDKIDFNFPEHIKKENIKIMKENYSYEKLIYDWDKIFKD